MAATKRSPAPPPELPGFTFERHLGSGGFSDVYLYEQHLPRRKVAIKVLLGGDDLEETSRQAFIGEANVMAQVSSHPCIVTIFHADVANDGRPYFVMEYAPGRCLSERYRTERIPVDEVLRTGVRIASAVATAHSAGVLHRDIKPANVLTNAFGWPALTDFGISSAVDDDVAGAVQGTTLGGGAGMSVPWSSPEMFEDDPQPDVRSEVFSLGATIYSLVAGHTPFEIRGGKNGTIDLIRRIERGDISPIERPDVPRALVSVLQRAMARRPEHRYATAIEFARALQRIELELGYAPTAIDVPSLHVEAPARDELDDDATSLRNVPLIHAEAPSTEPIGVHARTRERIAVSPPEVNIVHSGARASTAERTVTRRALRIAARHDDATATLGAPGLPDVATQASLIDASDRFDEPGRPRFGGGQGRATPVPERAREHGHGAPADPLADPLAEPARPKSRNVSVGIFAGVVALVLVALAIIGWVFLPADDPTAGVGTGTGGSDSVVAPIPPGDFPRTPTAPTATRAESGMITFTWINPDEQPDDIYYWQPADGSAPGTTTNETLVTVGPYPVDAKVCIEVETRRAGKVSPMPLTACYP